LPWFGDLHTASSLDSAVTIFGYARSQRFCDLGHSGFARIDVHNNVAGLGQWERVMGKLILLVALTFATVTWAAAGMPHSDVGCGEGTCLIGP
jgi:hypothetical protein